MKPNKEKEGLRLIAHRGLSGLEKENTCAAFVAAGNRNCYYGIQTELHITRDGQFVLISDDDTGRVGDRPLLVEQSTYLDLSKVHLNDMDGQVGRRDLLVPLLTDYLSICRRYGKECFLQLMHPLSKSDLVRVISEFQNAQYLDHTVFLSGCLENLIALREMLPEQRLQYVVQKKPADNLMNTLIIYQLGLDIAYKLLNQNLIDSVHQQGLEINCWTVNNVDHAGIVATAGVDYMTTDILEF